LEATDTFDASATLLEPDVDFFRLGTTPGRFDRLLFNAGLVDFCRSLGVCGCRGGPWLGDLAIDGIDLFNRITLPTYQIYFSYAWQAMVDLKLRSGKLRPA
jgi:hypothetical protein